MKKLALKFDQHKNIQYAVFFSAVLFLSKFIYDADASAGLDFNFLLLFINEALVFLSFYFITSYLSQFVRSKASSPLSIVVNAGILSAVLFFIISVSSAFEVSENLFVNRGFVSTVISLFFAFIFIGSLAYIFAVFKELFFLRQKKNPAFYFNLMFTFILLASFSNMLYKMEAEYIKQTFFVIAVLLISFNSIRIAWIAFLSKKEKLILMGISIVLLILFVVNAGLGYEGSFINSLLLDFSPSFHELFKLIMVYGAIYFGVIFFTALFHLPTAEAFDRKALEASSLMHLTKLITQVFDIKELGETVADTTVKVCNSDAAWLFIEEDGEVTFSSVKNIGYVEAERISRKILENKDYSKLKGALTFDLTRYDLDGTMIKSLAFYPLKIQHKLNGYLFAGRKSDYQFDEDDKKAITAFADYASIAIENAKLLEESIEKERLEKELDVAREVQRKILPKSAPNLKQLEISAIFVPAFEVGGDYYDFFELGGDKFAFVIADVSGKGISAAFVMAEVKGIFESLSKISCSPKETLIKANDALRKSLDKKSFVTAAYGCIDLKNGLLKFSRCGHTPAILTCGSGSRSLRPSGLGLGIDNTEYFGSVLEEIEVQLNDGDILTLYTDGIPEAQNGALDEFGYERIEEIIIANKEKHTEEMANKIMSDVSVFSQGNPQRDDITMVLLKWHLKQ
jgi:serine phosphatase RsbU (regulator of sigma subunit)